MGRFRIDPWGPLLALAALGVLLLRGFEGRLGADPALYAYAGQQLAEGAPPYVGVQNRAGPLAHLVPGLGAMGARAIGIDDLLGIRLLMALVSVGAVWVAYLVARDTFRSRAVGAVGGGTLLALQGFVELGTSGPREKTTMVLFVLRAISRRAWLYAGVAVALATLAWQPSFLPASVAVLAAAVLEPSWRARLRAVLGVVLGGLTVLAVTVAGFAAVDAVPEFYEGFVGVHLGGYTTQATVLDRLAAQPASLVEGYGWSVGLLALGTVATLVLAGAVLARPGRGHGTRPTRVALGAGTLGCLAWTLVAYQGWPDSLVLLPFAALGVAGAAGSAARVLPDRAGRRTLATVAVCLVVAAAASSWSSRPTGLAGQRELAADMIAAAGPDATVQSFASSAPLVLTGRTNPTRYVNFGRGLARYIDEQVPGGLAGLAADVERREPTLLVMGKPHAAGYTWLRPVLREHYVLLGGSREDGFWFATTSLEDERVDDLRGVLEDAGVPTASPRA
ncbi:hypothetical protein [Nocardioides euryhalodurans]|uniref:Glycosyltransferase RgtA/B/C/D-like domain-containing protein n=1 Tax=Nocardioides euryhalodurans TaxID=2518370 RepID=A0A4P7GNK4_9ACTN|nr:hypothetical protein [Nocardioides euryhalodurans]QBR93660.1 hypothetical protein EXE57_16295 [Nocardioides euryhalodurans]